MKKIMCPYCFWEFDDSEVHFRMETVMLSHSRGFKRTPGMTDEEVEKEEKKLQYQDLFLVNTEDYRYHHEFWGQYHGTTEVTTDADKRIFGSDIEIYQLPVLDPNNPNHQNGLEPRGKKENEENNYFIFDESGMVQAVTDIYGNTTQRRVCPKCHNPLPNGYGKHCIRLISVIGGRGSGKTVYLSQLLKDLSHYVSKLGISALPSMNVNNYVNANPVKKGERLPLGTRGGRFAQPLFFNITYGENENKTTETIVLYDIAGEDVVDNDGGGALERYGKFIIRSSGIIMMIDPEQLGLVTSTEDREENDPPPSSEAVYNAIKAAFGDGFGCNIPIAVCISKADKLSEALPEVMDELPPVFEENNVYGRRIISVMNAEQYNLLQPKLQYMLGGENPTEPLIVNLNRDNIVYNYFAISAIGCNAEEKEITINGKTETANVPIDTPNPRRIEEPLFWLLHRFGILPASTQLRLPYLRPHPPTREYREKKWYGSKTMFAKWTAEELERNFHYEEDLVCKP